MLQWQLIMPRNIRILVLFLLLVFSIPLDIFASNIKNDVTIKSNTGGNSVSGNDSSTTIKTGDSNTSVRIQNDVNGSSNTTNQESTTMDIQVETDGGGENNISIEQNDQSLKLQTRDGKATLETTTNGQTETREFAINEGITVHFDDGELKIEPSGDDIVLSKNGSRIYTEGEVKVDQETRNVSVTFNDTEYQLEMLPDAAVPTIQQNSGLDQIDNPVRLAVENNQLVYIVSGIDNKKLLGLVPVAIEKQLTVSAQDGSVTLVEMPDTKSKVLNWLSV